jgi:hypothetical protein
METKMNNNTNQPKRPSHAIYQVIGEDNKARWIRVGAAWSNKDGKGFTLKFDAYPVVGRTVIREMPEQDASAGNGGQP